MGACPAANFYQPFGQKICNAFVDPKGIRPAAQSETEWCWAATISNIFAYYGHVVEQDTIVDVGLGAIVDQPGSLHAIQDCLNRSWTDTDGNKFTSHASILYAPEAGAVYFTNDQVLNQLQSDHPLLICNMSHAMMLVSANYVPPMNAASNVAASIVFDPWPGIGLRALSYPEQKPAHMGGQLRLLTRVLIS